MITALEAADVSDPDQSECSARTPRNFLTQISRRVLRALWPRMSKQPATWTRSGDARPRSRTSTAFSKPSYRCAGPAACTLTSETAIMQPNSRVASSRRLARLTTSPTTVNSSRSSEPRLPTTTGPKWTPIAIDSLCASLAARLAFHRSISAYSSKAHAMARAEASPPAPGRAGASGFGRRRSPREP
jgi:hypothetical protein